MMGSCDRCYEIGDILPLEIQPLTAAYKQWDTIGGRLAVVEKKAPIVEIISKLKEQAPAFKKHSNIKNVQSKFFKDKKDSIGSNECILQIDFAENYALISQDEIQSAHWRHSQVTIFTACAWLDGKLKSFAIVSDELCHDKYAVWTFLKAIIEELKKFQPELSKVCIFSDGCAARNSKINTHYPRLHILWVITELT